MPLWLCASGSVTTCNTRCGSGRSAGKLCAAAPPTLQGSASWCCGTCRRAGGAPHGHSPAPVRHCLGTRWCVRCASWRCMEDTCSALTCGRPGLPRLFIWTAEPAITLSSAVRLSAWKAVSHCQQSVSVANAPERWVCLQEVRPLMRGAAAQAAGCRGIMAAASDIQACWLLPGPHAVLYKGACQGRTAAQAGAVPCSDINLLCWHLERTECTLSTSSTCTPAGVHVGG